MRTTLSLPLIASAFGGLVLMAAHPARADPSLGYLDAAYELPWHYAVRSDEVDDKRVDQTELLRTAPASGFSGGLGIGYNGLNGQIDFRNSLGQTTGAATIGWRLKLSFAGFELWGRAGLGPSLVIDTHAPNTSKIVTVGGLTSDFEAGLDYFVLSWLAVGLKGLITPQYNWPTNFSMDMGINLGLRAAI